MHQQVAISIHFRSAGAAQLKPDPAGIGAWVDDKVVFQLALAAVVNEINSRIDLFILHLGIGRKVAMPPFRIIADEVIDLAAQFFSTGYFRFRIGVDQLHPQHCFKFRFSSFLVSVLCYPCSTASDCSAVTRSPR